MEEYCVTQQADQLAGTVVLPAAEAALVDNVVELKAAVGVAGSRESLVASGTLEHFEVSNRRVLAAVDEALAGREHQFAVGIALRCLLVVAAACFVEELWVVMLLVAVSI